MNSGTVRDRGSVDLSPMCSQFGPSNMLSKMVLTGITIFARPMTLQDIIIAIGKEGMPGLPSSTGFKIQRHQIDLPKKYRRSLIEAEPFPRASS